MPISATSPRPPRTRAAQVRLVDPAALMRIKNLQLRARVVVEGFYHGLHRSPFHGFSVEFSEYRQYAPGDDPHYLDWRVYARTDRYFVKRFEDETNLRCYLLVDQSRSMSYGSQGYAKAAYAATAAATLAYLMALQRDAVGLIAFDQQVRDHVPPRYRPGHLRRLMLLLERAPGGEGTDLGRPLEQAARLLTKRGLVVLLSDLLAPPEQLEAHLGQLRSRGHEVIILRVLDPQETAFRFDDASLFYDLESGRTMYVDPEAARREYLERFAAHRAALRETCLRLAVELVELSTDQPLELALFDFLQARMRWAKRAVRRRAAAPGRRGGGGER